jgi:hypothetical protein
LIGHSDMSDSLSNRMLLLRTAGRHNIGGRSRPWAWHGTGSRHQHGKPAHQQHAQQHVQVRAMSWKTQCSQHKVFCPVGILEADFNSQRVLLEVDKAIALSNAADRTPTVSLCEMLHLTVQLGHFQVFFGRFFISINQSAAMRLKI